MTRWRDIPKEAFDEADALQKELRDLDHPARERILLVKALWKQREIGLANSFVPPMAEKIALIAKTIAHERHGEKPTAIDVTDALVFYLKEIGELDD